jgi:hypothetical protein
MNTIQMLGLVASTVNSTQEYVGMTVPDLMYTRCSDGAEWLEFLKSSGLNPNKCFTSRLAENGERYLATPGLWQRDGKAIVVFHFDRGHGDGIMQLADDQMVLIGDKGCELPIKNLLLPVRLHTIEPLDSNIKFTTVSALKGRIKELKTGNGGSGKLPSILDLCEEDGHTVNIEATNLEIGEYTWKGQTKPKYSLLVNGVKYSVPPALGSTLAVFDMMGALPETIQLAVTPKTVNGNRTARGTLLNPMDTPDTTDDDNVPF